MGRKKASNDRTSRRAARLALGASLLVPAVLGQLAHAVVLGSVQLRSNLGQPLVAEVELLDVDADSLRAGLAAPGVHAQHGFQAPHLLGRVDVRMVQKRDGRRVLRLTSERAVNEPTLELLLQAEDRSGGIVRYVPLLLDPAPPLSAQASARDEEAAPGQAESLAAVAPAPSGRRAAAADRATSAAPPSRRTRAAAGDESSVARSPAATRRAAAAPRRAAPTAAAEHTAMPASAALADRPAALAVDTSAASASATAPGASSASAAAPATPVIAGGADHASHAAAPVAATPAQPAAPAEAAALPASGTPAAQPASTTPAARRAPETMAPPMAAPSWLGDSAWLLAPAGLLAGGLLALGWRRRQRGRATDAPALDPVRDSQLFAPAGESRAPLLADKPPHGRPRHGPIRHSSIFSSSAFEMMEDVDPLAEADVYIAYGRSDHARAILEEALRVHPERAALHLKLLAILHERRDALAFAHHARALAELTARRGPDWQQAAAMGQRLDPGNPLYGDGPLRAAVAADPGGRQPAGGWAHSTLPAASREPPTVPAQLPARPLVDADAPRNGLGPIDFTLSDLPANAASTASDTGSATAPAPTAEPDRHVIDFDLSDMDSWPTNARRAPIPAAAATATPMPPVAGHAAPATPEPPGAAALALAVSTTSAARETVVDEALPAANASRFGDLPLKLGQLKQLSTTGDPAQAAQVGLEVAELIRQLRREAYQIMALAQRRA